MPHKAGVFIFLLSTVAVLSSCSQKGDDSQVSEVAVFQFEQPQGNERALGTLAEKGNFNSMEADGYNQLDEPAYARYDMDEIQGAAVVGNGYLPTQVYRTFET